MCDILKGKEFKPARLTALSISFVLLLLMLLSRPHTWCSAEQMLWKGGSARSRESAPGGLGVKPLTPLLRRPAPAGCRSGECLRRAKASPSPSAPKPSPRKLFLKCKSDQDNHELKTLQWPHMNHSKNPTACPPWSMGWAGSGVMVSTPPAHPQNPLLQNLSQV